MRAIRASAILVGLISGCSSGGGISEADRAEAKQRLQKVMGERDELSKTITAVPQEDREACELAVGDCLVLVDERREKLIRTHGLSSCDAFPEPAREARCIANQLSNSGKESEAGDYYAYENWCLQKVVACTVERAEQARLAALEARFEKRKQEIETSPEGLASWNAVELQKARVEYLRTTLPPKAADTCPPQSDVTECQSRFAGDEKAFHEVLRREDYDPKLATSAFASMKQTEASCQKPEFDCLSSAVSSYGVFPESRKWVDRNLALLARRQELTSLVDAEAQAECLTDPATQHQPRIVGAYTSYAREPVLFFRTQLDRAFLAMHEAQVSCLSGKSKAAKPPASTAVSARVD